VKGLRAVHTWIPGVESIDGAKTTSLKEVCPPVEQFCDITPSG
jgi:hypothetical protein